MSTATPAREDAGALRTLEVPPGTALVIGAGPAGLAVAGALASRGGSAVILEASGEVGVRWGRRYDALRLNTARRHSGLPGLPIPRADGTFPTARAYQRYLADYASRLGLEIHLEQPVAALEHGPGGWEAVTPTRRYRAATVVLATGHDGEPVLPEWSGRDAFRRPLIHAAEYRNAGPYVGLDVLVVGSGNSAADIAVDLALGGAGGVQLAVRTPPHICPRQLAGIPMQSIAIALGHVPPALGDRIVRLIRRVAIGDLSDLGLPVPAEGLSRAYARTGMVPILERGRLPGLVRARRIEVVAAVEALDGDEVVLADGRRLRPDAVIAATGYRTNLDGLVGDRVELDAHGLPAVHAPVQPPGAPGLYLAGYRNPIDGNLLDIARQADELADHLLAPSGPLRARPPAVDDPIPGAR